MRSRLSPISGRQVGLVLLVATLALATTSAPASAKRFDFCVTQKGGALAPLCKHDFVIAARDSGGIRAGFRDHRAPRHGEGYEVCIKRQACTSTRYVKRFGRDGRLIWDLPPLDVTTPGRYVAVWYLVDPTGRQHRIGRWRFRARLPAGLPSNAMPIDSEVEHLFSQASNSHGGVLGYDADGDGVIDRRNESVRTDADGRAWDGDRLFNAAGGNAGSISRAAFTTWFRKFDSNHDGRLVMTRRSGHPAGEFASACKAVWGDTDACQSVTLTTFEKDLFGVSSRAEVARAAGARHISQAAATGLANMVGRSVTRLFNDVEGTGTRSGVDGYRSPEHFTYLEHGTSCKTIERAHAVVCTVHFLPRGGVPCFGNEYDGFARDHCVTNRDDDPTCRDEWDPYTESTVCVAGPGPILPVCPMRTKVRYRSRKSKTLVVEAAPQSSCDSVSLTELYKNPRIVRPTRDPQVPEVLQSPAGPS